MRSSGPSYAVAAVLQRRSASSSTGSVGTSPIPRTERRDVLDAVLAPVPPRTGRDCPADGGLRAQVLCEGHDGPLGGHFGRAKTGSPVRRLAFWLGQDVDVAEYVRSCQTCQRTKAEHCGPLGILYPLPLPSRGGMIEIDWIAGLPSRCRRRLQGLT